MEDEENGSSRGSRTDSIDETNQQPFDHEAAYKQSIANDPVQIPL